MSEIVFEDEYLSDREIIAFVHSNPLLWQKRIKIDKKNKDTINQAFSQIGSLLSKPLTGDAVSTRWKSLRDQYSREMRKVIASQPRSGAGSEELSYKSTWLLFNELSFLKDVIKPRKTQSNVSRKKLKLSEDTKASNSSFNIVIPSSIMRIPKNTETIMWRDSQIIQESQVIEESEKESQIVEENQVEEERSQIVEENQVEEESQVIEESQAVEENVYLWNVQVAEEDAFKKTNTAANESFDDNVSSVSHSWSMSTSGSQSSIVPPPDRFYTKKKAAMEQVHGIIKSTAAKINSVCDTISVNLTQPEPECISSIEEDSALVLIKSILKKVPSQMKVKCLSDIMLVLDKYSSNVPE